MQGLFTSETVFNSTLFLGSLSCLARRLRYTRSAPCPAMFTGDRYISYLPLAHIYERGGLTLQTYQGGAVGFYRWPPASRALPGI